MQNVFCVNLLHPYLPVGTQYEPHDPLIADENQEYEIKKIVTHKMTRCKILYQVRYWGSDAIEDR